MDESIRNYDETIDNRYLRRGKDQKEGLGEYFPKHFVESRKVMHNGTK